MSGRQPPRPIAQVFCRLVDRGFPTTECSCSDAGFIGSQPGQEKCRWGKGFTELDVDIFAGHALCVGRDQDNDVAILHDWVSRQHFVLYSIEYESDSPMKPLVYVRDCGSLSGTYVDDRSSPSLRKLSPTVGHLLSDGEVIVIQPFWEFHVCLLRKNDPGAGLGQVVEVLQRPGEILQLSRRNFLVMARMLGYGSLATVHLAINTATKRQVACKIHDLVHLRSSAPNYVSRVLGEANLLSRLSHPNLLRFEAAFRSQSTLYTFTELATGGDLFSLRLRYPSGLPEMDIKVILWQVVAAVGYLHDQNVVHRDLKPENVFLSSGPNISRVVVGDFGFATVNRLGRLESRVGTRGFMAPEVHVRSPYSYEPDIWSIGMLSLFLTAVNWETVPYLEALDQEDVDHFLSTTFTVLKGYRRELSGAFEDFIRSCLKLNPSYRVTTKACKCQKWFCSSKPFLEAQVKALTKGWEPAQIVGNNIEDLDSPPPEARTAEGGGSQPPQSSPYFANVGHDVPHINVISATQERVSTQVQGYEKTMVKTRVDQSSPSASDS